MRLPTFYEQNLIPNWGNYFLLLPVKTKGLKIAAQLQKGASGGVIEWKVN